MTSKRDVLLAICETPGWSATDPPSWMTQALDQLIAEGWIIERLDGYEASPQALDAYPKFAGQDDIAYLDSIRAITDESGEHTRAGPNQEVTLPTLFIRNGQRTEARFSVGPVQGTVVVANEQHTSPLIEVTLTVSVKPA